MTPEDRAADIVPGPGPLNKELRAAIAHAIREAVAAECEECAKMVEPVNMDLAWSIRCRPRPAPKRNDNV